MAKLSRVALKGLIKECLVEILQEGLNSDVTSLTEMQFSKPAPRRKRRQAPLVTEKHHHPGLDTPLFEERSPSLSNRMPKVVASASDNPAMQALLEDTARTTYRSQQDAEGTRGPQAQSDIPLEGLDFLGANRATWEALAFSDKLVDPLSIKVK